MKRGLWMSLVLVLVLAVLGPFGGCTKVSWAKAIMVGNPDFSIKDIVVRNCTVWVIMVNKGARFFPDRALIKGQLTVQVSPSDSSSGGETMKVNLWQIPNCGRFRSRGPVAYDTGLRVTGSARVCAYLSNIPKDGKKGRKSMCKDVEVPPGECVQASSATLGAGAGAPDLAIARIYLKNCFVHVVIHSTGGLSKRDYSGGRLRLTMGRLGSEGCGPSGSWSLASIDRSHKLKSGGTLDFNTGIKVRRKISALAKILGVKADTNPRNNWLRAILRPKKSCALH